MTLKVNQRVKRKNNFSDIKSEPNMKALKKEDIIVQFNALQAKFNIIEKKNIDLEQEKKSHIEAITLLEETVKILEEQASLRKAEKITKNVQTDTSNLEGENRKCICGVIVTILLTVYMISMITPTAQMKKMKTHFLHAIFVMKVLKHCQKS